MWGLQQFGIRAVIAPSFAEIFYSNAMNNRLLLVALPQEQVAALMQAADDPATASVRIDVETMTVRCGFVAPEGRAAVNGGEPGRPVAGMAAGRAMAVLRTTGPGRRAANEAPRCHTPR